MRPEVCATEQTPSGPGWPSPFEMTSSWRAAAISVAETDVAAIDQRGNRCFPHDWWDFARNSDPAARRRSS